MRLSRAFMVKKIAVVTNYNFRRTHGRMPPVCHVRWQLFFDITFMACAASLIESPGRGGRYVAPGFIPGLKAIVCSSISAQAGESASVLEKGEIAKRTQNSKEPLRSRS